MSHVILVVCVGLDIRKVYCGYLVFAQLIVKYTCD